MHSCLLEIPGIINGSAEMAITFFWGPSDKTFSDLEHKGNKITQAQKVIITTTQHVTVLFMSKKRKQPREMEKCKQV